MRSWAKNRNLFVRGVIISAGGKMKIFKSILMASAVTLSLFAAGSGGASAGIVSSPSASVLAPQATKVFPIERVRERRYNRRRHGRRHRRRRGRHRHYHRGYWYATPWWTIPLYAAPRRFGRCERWHRRCRVRWGRGRDYRGCMRHHGCL